MPQSLNLNYYYGNESEQYNFYRIPKVLFTDKRYHSVSAEAKVLYGLMLDRMSLSAKNGWLDKENRVYIFFTMEDVMELMNCGHGKAVKLFAELDTVKGIGLIERKKQGQGKPTIIYVKNFIASLDVQTSENGKPKDSTEHLTSEAKKSRLPNVGTLDFPKSNTNNTDINNTELSHTDLSYPSKKELKESFREYEEMDKIDRMEEIHIYREIIMDNIDYSIFVERNPYDKDIIDGLVELMVDAITSSRKTIRLDQQDIPKEVVKSRFLKLDYNHIDYVIECCKKNTTKVRNIKSYLLTALYHASSTISSYYRAEVNHDIYGTSG